MARARRQQEAGFTLVELMISLTVVSIAIAAAFTMAFSLLNGFRDNRGAVQVESTTRIVLDIIAQGVRSASPGMRDGQLWDTCSGGIIDAIEVTNSSTGPDELRVVHASGGALASMTASAAVVTDGAIVVDSNADFELNIWTPAIVIDPLNAKAHFIEIRRTSASAVKFETQDLQGSGCAGGAGTSAEETYPAGSLVVRAVHMNYRVDPPYLMVDPDGAGDEKEIVVAEGIEDMQIAVAVEDESDKTTLTNIGAAANDDEWHYNVAGEAAAGLLSGKQWRSLRISIVGYTIRDQNASTSSLRPALEDRPVASTGDGYRRRTFSTIVHLRNFSTGI